MMENHREVKMKEILRVEVKQVKLKIIRSLDLQLKLIKFSKVIKKKTLKLIFL